MLAFPKGWIGGSAGMGIADCRAKTLLRAARVAALAAVLLAPPTQSPAHYWYPRECCNDQDCFKVHKTEFLDDGSMIMHAGHFVVVVPPGFPVRKSLDDDSHVCVYRNVLGKYLPRCVFMPGTV
jgi:hypothetical protein